MDTPSRTTKTSSAPQQGRRRSSDDESRTGNFYIDPSRFTELLITYQETGSTSALDALTTEFFYPLALGVIRKKQFRLIDQDDAVQECVLQCIRQIKKYNPNHATVNEHSTGDPKRKAFAFFTTCIVNTLKCAFRKETSQVRGRQQLFLLIVDKDHRTSNSKVARRTRTEVMAGQEQDV